MPTQENDNEYVFDPNATVIVEVSGGVAFVSECPDNVEALIVDYDNTPDAVIEYYEINGVQWGRVVYDPSLESKDEDPV